MDCLHVLPGQMENLIQVASWLLRECRVPGDQRGQVCLGVGSNDDPIVLSD